MITVDTLAQIEGGTSKPFTAGIVLRAGRVIEAAPIVRYMRGWSRDRVREYCARAGWRVVVVCEIKSASNEVRA